MPDADFQKSHPNPLLDREDPGRLVFDGPQAARLFTREVEESMRGVLSTTFSVAPSGRFPVGFVQASVEPRYWWETMWTRDAGTFLRELVAFGYLRHACLCAACLMDLVDRNEEGCFSFPRYFKGGLPGHGSELDGTGSIVIAMVLLWEHLGAQDPMRRRLGDFLHAKDSPVRYMAQRVEAAPLIAGSGEFGGGCFIEGEYCNVVQNGLARLALLAAARLEQAAGHTADADCYCRSADKLAANMLAHMVGPDGAWLWCVVPATLKPDPAVLNHPINKGFGGINGVYCMQADVLGPDPRRWDWPAGIETCGRTFEKLLNTPLRRQMLERRGIWTQFDEYNKGLTTSPSYGHAYALQSMLLMDRLDLAAKSANWLAEQTYQPVEGLHLDRQSPYHFYEAMYTPEAAAVMKLKQGAGALNLVNVAEPLKCARLIAGIDDSDARELRVVPRLPDGWTGVEAVNWPVRVMRPATAGGASTDKAVELVRIDVRCRRRDDSGLDLNLTCRHGAVLPAVSLRAPMSRGGEYQRFENVSKVQATL